MESRRPPNGRLSRVSPYLDRAIRAGARLPDWVSAALIVLMLAAAAVLVYVTGGTHRALPHLFYVPIIFAVLPFGLPGAVVTALAAAVVCGPFMPLNSVTGEAQTASMWLVRGAMFLLVGVAAALATEVRERFSEQRMSSEVHAAITRTATGTGTAVDEELVPLVARVLADRAFHPVFQPVYALADGRLIAVEALTRFDAEPARSPDRWFAAAERAGLGRDLEIAAIEAALAATRDLPDDVVLSVNASPATLGDARLLDLVRAHPRRQMVVEITEHAVVEDYHLLRGTVGQLRELGVRIAVDDAGAGIASLRHIVQLGPETIKLDISLTQGVGSSPLRRALASSLIEFAQHTGAQLVVEGIEEEADLTTWTAMGAHAAQGYLVGRPGGLPVAASSTLIATLRGARA